MKKEETLLRFKNAPRKHYESCGYKYRKLQSSKREEEEEEKKDDNQRIKKIYKLNDKKLPRVFFTME